MNKTREWQYRFRTLLRGPHIETCVVCQDKTNKRHASCNCNCFGLACPCLVYSTLSRCSCIGFSQVASADVPRQQRKGRQCDKSGKNDNVHRFVLIVFFRLVSRLSGTRVTAQQN